MKRTVFAVLALIALPAIAQEIGPLPNKSPSALEAKLVALKARSQRPVPPTPLPGLGMMPGESDPNELKPQDVHVSENKTTVINVSATLTNRISTPFAKPKEVDSQPNDFVVKEEGQSIYVTPITDKPISLYVTGNQPNDPVISLTLIPAKMPPQTINLLLDRPLAAVDSSGSNEKAPDSNVYTDKIRYVLRQIALGKTPEGFSEGSLPASVARMGQVMAYPLSRYSGPNYDVYRYRLEALADVELDETAFYTDDVRAVAFFPNSSLHRGESTEVYVVSDKTESN